MGVHQKGVVVGVKQQRLITCERQAAVRLIGGLQNAIGALQFFCVWQVNHRPCGTQQPGQGNCHQQYRAPQG
ncbi:hypothetical protein D3C77_613320 [compost metagenome]